MKDKYPELDDVLSYIHRNISEQLSLWKLAKHAAYSPYHFSRIFKEKTGLSPHYYVSSLKIQKAKELLLNSDLTVRDIGLEIGQQSLGTFTTRFTERVGVSPKQFRKSTFHVHDYLEALQNLSAWSSHPLKGNVWNRVEGSIDAEVPFQGIVFIGLFTKPIPEGLPSYGTLLSSLGPFRFTNVFPGTYYLMATAVSWETKIKEILIPQQTLRAKMEQPIKVGASSVYSLQQIILRGPRLDDPPILISLPLLMKNFLSYPR